MLLILEKILML